MDGAATADGEAGALVRVTLTCISCGTVEEIHVFREREPPGNILWECFDCQERGSRTGKGPDAAGP